MGFEIGRFTTDVDDFFVCKACSSIVQQPVECAKCEHLQCKECGAKCVYCGCEQLKIPAKFVRLMYGKLHLRCGYSSNGCDIEGSVSEVEGHEPNCLHVLIECDSPICNRFILKSNRKEGPLGTWVCSRLCSSVIAFKNSLSSSKENELLEMLKNAVLSSKEELMEQVLEEIKPRQQELDNRELEIKRAEQEINELKQELFARRYMHHPGKWNYSQKKWTCCGNDDKAGIGCFKL